MTPTILTSSLDLASRWAAPASRRSHPRTRRAITRRLPALSREVLSSHRRLRASSLRRGIRACRPGPVPRVPRERRASSRCTRLATPSRATANPHRRRSRRRGCGSVSELSLWCWSPPWFSSSQAFSATRLLRAAPAGTVPPSCPQILTALSEGRADDAKALLGSSSALDGALLTADVLKDSLSRAPITNIQVNEPTGSDPTFRVPVSYTIGDSTATEDFKVDAASKKIETQLPKLRISQGSKADLTVNGTAVKSDEVTVFPGSYQVASGNKYLELKGETQALVKNSLESNYVSVEFTPSQAGIDLFREKVLPEAKACLASANLDPGCNMALSESLSDGTTLTDGTIKRTQDSEASATMENVTPKVGSSVPTILSSNEFGNFKISATCTKGGRTGECNVLGFGSKGTRWPKASINVADADPKVTWENS